MTVCSLFACAFLELGQCYFCPDRVSRILKQLRPEHAAFYLLRVLGIRQPILKSLHRGTPGLKFRPYFWYLIMVNILTCFVVVVVVVVVAECESPRVTVC